MSKNRYFIPANITEGGRVLNGLFELRKVVEGVALAAGGGLITISISGGIHIRPLLVVCLPLFLLGAIGVGGDPLSVFVRNVYTWSRNKQVMLYNPHTDAYDVPVGDMLLSIEQPLDKLGQGIAAVQSKFSSNKTDDIMIEGRDFVFKSEEEQKYASRAHIPQYLNSDTLGTDGKEEAFDFDE